MEELKSFCNALINQIEGDLLIIRIDNVESAKWAQSSISYLKNSLGTLNIYIQDHPFRKRSEEIYFFKYVKPIVMGRLIFMCEVHNTEVFRNAPHTEMDKIYLNEELQKINKYFERYKDFYKYYKNDDHSLDTKFFVRSVKNRFSKNVLPLIIDPVYFYGASDFSTSFDYVFAKLRAMELLKDHLENELEASALSGNDVLETKIEFTGTTANFVVMVKVLTDLGSSVHPDTGLPLTEEEMFEKLKDSMEINFPDDMDYNTLKLISGGDDEIEKMINILFEEQAKSDEEEGDIDYRTEE